MDYLKTLIRLTFILFVVNSILGCDTEVSPEPLQIKGTPPQFIYYDSTFEYKFGASGGDGVYRYRYIQNPQVDFDEELEDNPVEMSIEVVDDAEPGFILRATPGIPANLDDTGEPTFRYQIEITDGKNTSVETFEFTLKRNKIRFQNLPQIKEGQVSNQTAINLQRQIQFEEGPTSFCSELSENTYEKKLTDRGYVYPAVIEVKTDAPVASKTVLHYRFISKYNVEQPERSSQNINFARQDVDYNDEERFIVLEPGVNSCVVYIELFDDYIVEDEEQVSIEFFKIEGGAVEYKSAKVNLEIIDNELQPLYVSDEIVRSIGDKIIVPIYLSRPSDFPTIINVTVDPEKTTANENDYKLEPASGVITIPPGDTVASYSITLLDNSEGNTPSYVDKIITLTTDIDDIVDAKPYIVEINVWAAAGGNIDSEIVGREKDNEEVVDFIADGEGVITALIKSNSGGDSVAKLRSYNRDSSPTNFSSLSQLVLSELGMDVVPRAIVHNESALIDNLAVVINVDGLYGNKYMGGTDFVVLHFQKERGGQYQLTSSKQYGSEGDDIVTGAILNNDTVYVYGKTNGESFEGVPGFETNYGGEDGFLYAISLADNSFKWARFIGTSNQDNVVSVDAGFREIIAFVSTLNSDQDAIVRKFSSETGLDIEDEEPLVISTRRDDRPVSVRFDATASNYRVLLDSDANLESIDQFTPSLSRDVQALTYNSKNEKVTASHFATDQEDIAKYLENMPDNLNMLVAGITYGELSGNTKRGLTGTDAFIAILDAENTSSLVTESIMQFGTSADDQLITIKPVSDTKFFALWSEKLTDLNDIVYRISAFSIDGKKLSRDPE